MNTLQKITTSAFFIALFLALSTTKVQATQGTIDLVSTTGEASRCYATSIKMPRPEYKILIACKDLIYPPTETEFVYVMWATPTAGGKPIKLGDLKYGKVEFISRKPFSELFVTIEETSRASKPSNNVVMRGSVQPIEFLETTQPTTEIPEEQEVTPTQPAESFGEILEQPLPSPTPTPTAAPTGLFATLRRGGVILVAIAFIVLLILAYLTRSRG
jgi:hypothetical protein